MQILENCTNPILINGKIAYACGQCPNCRKKNALMWALRARHELSTNGNKGIFITLTYSPKNLHRECTKKFNKNDKLGTLKQEDVQKFIKRLRKFIEKKYNKRKIKYIYCGEYGELKWRPHYHLIIFNIDNTEITQEEIKNIWKLGHADLDQRPIHDNAISYVLGYVKKKAINKQIKKEKYEKFNRAAPFIRYSQGIGKEWALKNAEGWANLLTIGFRGYRAPVPRYYIRLIKKLEGKTIRYKITTKYKIEIPDEQQQKTLIERLYNLEQQPKKKYEIVKITESYAEKIIENIENGKLTKIINEAIIRNKINNDKKFLINQKKFYTKEDYKELEKIIKLSQKEMWKFYKTKVTNYVKYWNKPNEKLKKIFTTEKEIILKKDKEFYQENKINKNIFKRMQSVAKLKEENLLNGIFGQRNKLEIMEEIYKTA